MNQLELPPSTIKTISKATTTKLRKLGIHTISDLLRVYPERLRKALGSGFTLDQISSWCNTARMLQISVMTPDLANALILGKIYTVDGIHNKNLTELRKVFVKARDDGIITDVPNDLSIATIMKESAVLDFTGALNGTIKDEKEQPIANAHVHVGNEHEITDERGRFRIIRIPFGVNSTLVVVHPKYCRAWFPLKKVNRSTFVGGEVFKLKRLKKGRQPSNGVLMEARGDILPPLGSSHVNLRESQRQKLLDHDIFVLAEFSADKNRVKLVSKLLVYEDGAFWLPYVWIPISDLGTDADIGNCYMLRGTSFRKITLNPIKLRGWPMMIRTIRYMGKPPVGVEKQEKWLENTVKMINKCFQPRERH